MTMTFVLKLKTNFDVENGIAVVSKSNTDTILRTYEKKDEILRTHEDGVAYSWFIITVNENEVIFVNNKMWKRYSNSGEDIKDTIFLNATPDLYWNAKKAGVTLPAEYTEALRTSLKEIFKFPVFSNKTRKWNSVKVFLRYKTLLNEIEKKVNDFVEQKEIDNFFEILTNLYAAAEIKAFMDGGLIRLSDNTKCKVDCMLSNFAGIRRWAFNFAKDYSTEHNWYTEWVREATYQEMTVTVKVQCYHLYVIFPYGKDNITECVGWFDD